MNKDNHKRKGLLYNEDAVIGGIIYMIIIIATSIILASVFMPGVDMLVITMGDSLAITPTASQGWQNASTNAEFIFKLFYKVFVIFAFGGVLYAVLTPLKKMLYDKYREYYGGYDQYGPY